MINFSKYSKQLDEAFDSSLELKRFPQREAAITRHFMDRDDDVDNVESHVATHDGNQYAFDKFDRQGATEVHFMPNIPKAGVLNINRSAIPLVSTAMNLVRPDFESGKSIRILSHPELHDTYSRILKHQSKRHNFDVKEIKDHVGPDGLMKSGWEIKKR